MNRPDRNMTRASSGELVILRSSQQLAAGGEGVVYKLPELSDMVAKVYHSPAAGIDVKLGLMIENPPRIPPEEEGRVAIAWPEDTLREPSRANRITGFLMRRVSGKPVIEYFNPLLRPRTASHFTYEHLLVVARNLAEAVDIFHGQHNVIGDLNESNVLVTETASVALIDTDSFQVLDLQSGVYYRSPVGKPEYTPAELQGHRFDEIDREEEHDRFGLAVIIYQLLMEGIHPFVGVYTGPGDPPQPENRIALGHFPHSRRRRVPFDPSPISPPWDTLHPQLQRQFVQCFDNGHDNPHTRPTAHIWVQTIEETLASLTTCRRNDQHKYFDQLPSCPWCDRARRMGGRDPFPPLQPGARPAQLSFSLASPPTPPAQPVVQPRVPPPTPPSLGPPSAAQSGGGFRWMYVAVPVGIVLFSLVALLIIGASTDDSGPDTALTPPTAPTVPNAVLMPTVTPMPTAAVAAMAVPTSTITPVSSPTPTFTPNPTLTPTPAHTPTITPMPTRDSEADPHSDPGSP